jgi:putative holliday junction resolvase
VHYNEHAYMFQLSAMHKHHNMKKEQVEFGTTVIGVDYGLKRVGMASMAGLSPRKLGTIPNNGPDMVIRDILKYAEAALSENIVIGLPLDIDGSDSNQSLLTRRFAHRLLKSSPLGTSVFFVDERFTSKFARARVRELSNRKVKHVDDESACVILEAFFQEGGERLYPSSFLPSNVVEKG